MTTHFKISSAFIVKSGFWGRRSLNYGEAIISDQSLRIMGAFIQELYVLKADVISIENVKFFIYSGLKFNYKCKEKDAVCFCYFLKKQDRQRFKAWLYEAGLPVDHNQIFDPAPKSKTDRNLM